MPDSLIVSKVREKINQGYTLEELAKILDVSVEILNDIRNDNTAKVFTDLKVKILYRLILLESKNGDYHLIANEVADLVKKKNRDYGSSFDNLIDKYGIVGYLIRISDKTSRIEALSKKNGNALVKDERMEDTLKDIIGYTILMINYIRNSKK